jgi:hypothetical protein
MLGYDIKSIKGVLYIVKDVEEAKERFNRFTTVFLLGDKIVLWKEGDYEGHALQRDGNIVESYQTVFNHSKKSCIFNRNKLTIK